MILCLLKKKRLDLNNLLVRENTGVKKQGKTYFIWSDLSVPGFLESKIIGGIIL